MNSEYVVFVAGGLFAVFGWLLNLVKSMVTKRLMDLEALHIKNFENIIAVDHRLTRVESNFVTQQDLRELLDILRDDINSDVNKSFSRIHARLDEVMSHKP
jgi:hypothetical protein